MCAIDNEDHGNGSYYIARNVVRSSEYNSFREGYSGVNYNA